MRTTVDLDKKLLEEVFRASGETSLNKAVNTALAEYVRRRKLDDLRAMIGRIGLDYDWKKEEEKELADLEKYAR